jgi:hypothetical protein
MIGAGGISDRCIHLGRGSAPGIICYREREREEKKSDDWFGPLSRAEIYCFPLRQRSSSFLTQIGFQCRRLDWKFWLYLLWPPIECRGVGPRVWVLQRHRSLINAESLPLHFCVCTLPFFDQGLIIYCRFRTIASRLQVLMIGWFLKYQRRYLLIYIEVPIDLFAT